METLKYALLESQKLSDELFSDKDKVGRLLKKEAPHIFRKLQLDVF